MVAGKQIWSTPCGIYWPPGSDNSILGESHSSILNVKHWVIWLCLRILRSIQNPPNGNKVSTCYFTWGGSCGLFSICSYWSTKFSCHTQSPHPTHAITLLHDEASDTSLVSKTKVFRKKFKAAASMYAWFQILLAGSLAGRIEAHMLNLLSPRCTMYNTKLYHVNEGHSLGMRGSRLYTLSLQKLPKHDWSDQLSIITSITETYLPSSVPSVVIKKVICTPLKGLSCNQWTFTRNAGQPNLVLFVIKPASIVPADSTNETLLYSLLRFHI